MGSLIDGTRGIPVDIGIHQKSVAMPSSMDVCISSISATVLTNKQNNKRQLPDDDDDCSSSGLEAPKLPANLIIGYANTPCLHRIANYFASRFSISAISLLIFDVSL